MDNLTKRLTKLKRLPYKSMIREIVTELKPVILEWNRQRLRDGKLSTGEPIKNTVRRSTTPHPTTINRKGINYFNLYDTGDFYASLSVTISKTDVMDGIVTKSRSRSNKVASLESVFTLDIYGLDEQKTEELRKIIVERLKIKIAKYLNL